jgi:hypothetical protein
MVTLPVDEFKSRFSDILKKVEKMAAFIICYGKKKQKVVAIFPFKKYQTKQITRKIDILKGRAHYQIPNDFKINDKELLHL